MIKVCVISLGCVKNEVDSETILSFLTRNNFEVITNKKEADAIIINTCGFIEDAKRESLNVIKDCRKYNTKIIVVGCLVERYYDELKELLPEVDLFIPIRKYKKMNQLIRGLFKTEIVEQYNPYYRVLSTPGYTAYLKISDGCSNHCAYCAIPLIRGEFSSVPKTKLLKEVDRLISLNIKELVIISQDTSKYGSDLYKDYNIASLLKDILKKKHFISIRLLYLYSYEVSDELLDLFRDNQKVLLPYFDIPIQHSSNKMLKAMNRKDTTEDILSLVRRIRKKMPKAILRTTLIVGFPGENESDITCLERFVKSVKFDHLGIFKYSKEEGTVGFDLPDQIDEEVKEERLKRIALAQQEVSYLKNKEHIGEEITGIVINIRNNQLFVRSYITAPDDVDGDLILLNDTKDVVNIGDVVCGKITNASIYDLEGIYKNKM